METLIMHPENKEQLTALKAIAKALQINFETSKTIYNPDFVTKIEKSKKEVEEGKVTRVKKEELQNFLGL